MQSLLSTRTPYEEFHRLFKSVPMDQFPINGNNNYKFLINIIIIIINHWTGFLWFYTFMPVRTIYYCPFTGVTRVLAFGDYQVVI